MVRRIVLPVALAALLAAGCTVGPNYTGPPAAAPRAATARKFVRDDGSVSHEPPAARWWDALNDPLLSQLVDQALADSPTIEAAIARVRDARLAVRARHAEGLPSLDATADYAHARLPGGIFNNGQSGQGQANNVNAFDFYNLGFDANWEIDLFGGGRRQIESARASYGARLADLADAQVSLAAEVGQAYVALRGAQQRLALAKEAVGLEQQSVDLARQRLGQGTASELDVARLNGQLETNRAALQPLAAEADGYRDTLAMLTGREPGALDDMLAAPAPIPLPPSEVAVGDPAGMLRRRPDIRAAERRLAASNAEIGANIAKMLPRLTFMGLIGIGGTSPSDLGHLSDFTAIVAPRLQWNFLDFGRNKAALGQARAKKDEATANYRKTVLAALRDAEDGLDRFAAQRVQVGGLARAEQSAVHAASLNGERYRAGTSSLIDQLDIERQRLDASIQLAQATATMTNDYIALQKSLGLGWAEPGEGGVANR